MFWAVPIEEPKKTTNHKKWIIPLGTFLAIAGICVTLILLGGNSSKSTPTSPAAAVPAVEMTTNGALSLNGKWTADLKSSTMIATITDDGIEIQWANEDTSALYWKGTFAVPRPAGDKFTIISQADRSAMDGSMLASQDSSKTFVYENRTINFSLTAIGVTTKVHLSR